MQWNKLEDLLIRTFYPIGISGDVANPLNRWLVKSAQRHSSSPFDEPVVDLGGSILLSWELDQLSAEVKETNWRFYISDMINRYQEPNRIHPLFTAQPDKYMYAATAVYCSEAIAHVINVLPYFPSPIRIWINGELVLCGPSTHVYANTHFMYRFRKGMNAVLVECPLSHPIPLTYNEFIVNLHPVDHLIESGRALYFDPEFLAYLKQAFRLIPERSEVRAGEPLRLLIQPLSFTSDADKPREALVLTALDRLGKPVASAAAASNEIALLHMPVTLPTGVIRFELRSRASESEKPLGMLHLPCGEISVIAAELDMQARSRSDCNAAVLRAVQFAARFPEMFREVNQYFNRDCREEALVTLYEAERYAYSGIGKQTAALHHVFSRSYTFVNPKTVSEGAAASTVMLPDQYDPKRKYPVVFFFHDPQARHIPVKPSWIPWATIDDAIVVALPGIGRLNYADDLQTVQTIENVIGRLNADREHIYGIGFCTGSVKLFRIAMLVPHLFAGIAPIIGDARLNSDQPEYKQIANLRNVFVNGLSSVQNWFFNSMRMRYTLSLLPHSELRMIHGYMHNEINDFFNSRLFLRELLTHRLLVYPQSIAFTVLNPACNKAYWAERIEIRDHAAGDAYLEAVWTDARQLCVRTEQIGAFTLLIGMKEAGCEQHFVLRLNETPHTIALQSEHVMLHARLADDADSIAFQQVPLTEEAFRSRLTAIPFDRSQLGIKSLHASNAIIVKPSAKNDSRRAFHIRLAYILQNPIRDRYIHYHYRSCTEASLEEENAARCSLLFLIDLRAVSAKQRHILDAFGLTISDSRLVLNGRSYEGDVAVVAVRREEDRRIGMAAYNSDRSGDALLGLWETFDSNPLFYEDTIVWNNGQAVGYRNR